MDGELLQFLSPLGWEHINLTGDYVWRQSRRLEDGSFGPYGCPENLSVRFFPNSAGSPMLPEQHAAEARYPIPVEDFHFSIFTAVNNQTVMTSSAEIVLVIEGTATLSHASGESLLLHVGLSAFIPASIGRWLLTTTGKVCRVSC